MNVKQDLINAKALIEDPENWCKRVVARTRDGLAAAPYGKDACQFCGIGAVWRITRAPLSEAYDHLNKTCFDLFGRSIPEVNDELGHESLMKAFDKAIDALPRSFRNLHLEKSSPLTKTPEGKSLCRKRQLSRYRRTRQTSRAK